MMISLYTLAQGINNLHTLVELVCIFPCTQAWVRLEAAEHEREVALRKELMRYVCGKMKKNVLQHFELEMYVSY